MSGERDGQGQPEEQRGSTSDPDKEQDQGGEGEGDDQDDDEEEKDSGPPLYKRPLFWIILIAVAVALIVGGTLYWMHARRFASTDDAFVDAHIVRIAAEEQGKLTYVASIDNRRVPAGTLLATIEPYASSATLDQARAQAAQAEAGIKQAEAQVIAAQAQEAQARDQARDPQAQATKAQADLQRYLALEKLDAAATSGTQIDQAREAAQSASAQAAAARRNIDNAAAQVAVAHKQVAAQQAQKAAAEAQVRSAQVTVHHLDIRAPVAGQVVNRSVNLGSYVSAGSQLMALVPDAIYVTANFKETQLTHMRVGQHVEIRVDAYPELTFMGHVDSIQHGAGQSFAVLPAQNATGNYVKVVQRVPVRIVFDTHGRDKHGHPWPDPHRYAIGPGMSVVPTVTVR